MNVSVRELRAFLYVANHRNFTRAAERLHITQAGLSAMIRALEQQIGSRLFTRTTRTVSLTDAGQSLLPVAARVVEEIDTIGTQLMEMSLRGKSTLRVGATPLIASKLLPVISKAFRAVHPEVTVKIYEAQRDAIEWMSRDGLIDIGLGVFVAPVAGVERRMLHKFRLNYVAAPAVIGRHRKRAALRWAEIPSVPLIGLLFDNPIQQTINQKLEQYRRLPGIDLSFNSIGMETQIAMTAAGMGAAIMPSFVDPALKNYNVVAVPLTPTVEIEFFCMMRRHPTQHAAIPDFISAVQACFSRLFR